MNSHGSITQHRFRAGGRNDNMIRLTGPGIDNRILEVPEISLYSFRKYFVVAYGSLQKRIPVYQSFPAINQCFLEQVEEGMSHRTRTCFIQCESRSLPIATATHLLQLAENTFFILLFPLPNSIDKLFPPKIVTRLAFFFLQSPFDDGLSRNARMVGSGNPQRIKALHSLQTNDNVLQRIIECVAKVKGTGHIRRRDNDRVGRFVRTIISVKTIVF